METDDRIKKTIIYNRHTGILQYFLCVFFYSNESAYKYSIIKIFRLLLQLDEKRGKVMNKKSGGTINGKRFKN